MCTSANTGLWPEPTVNLAEAHNETTMPLGPLVFISRHLFVKPMAMIGAGHGA